MARGRIIISDITKDRRVNDLSDDTSRLAFTWLITFADREGRTHGDPAVVRSMIFPRREDVTIAQMTRYIGEWATSGLVVWYECDGDQWIAFPSFNKHQVGFDQRHEPKSTIPDPPQTTPDSETDGVRAVYVQCTAEKKRKEMNRTEATARAEKTRTNGADAPQPSPLERHLCALWGVKRANDSQRELIASYERDYGYQTVVDAGKWAHTEGMTFGHALNALRSALKKWDTPKGNNGHPPPTPEDDWAAKLKADMAAGKVRVAELEQ